MVPQCNMLLYPCVHGLQQYVRLNNICQLCSFVSFVLQFEIKIGKTKMFVSFQFSVAECQPVWERGVYQFACVFLFPSALRVGCGI